MENSENKIFACPFENCSSVFKRLNKLQQHGNVHSGIRPFVCTEDNCSKSYTSKSHLNRHINSVHKKNDKYIIHSCPECLKVYSNRQNLKKHIKRGHINISGAFLCDICKRKFKKKNQLTAHMFQHNGIKAFKCDLCPTNFITLYEKKKHMRNHKTYTCDLCTDKFVRWSDFVKHRRTDHISKEYICDACGRKFQKKTHILRHIKTHSKVLERSFLCPYDNCGRRYSRNSNLKQHIFMKHEHVTHQCTICLAQLCSKSSLQKHTRIFHSGKEIKQRVPKTIETGRNFRKDKDSLKLIGALKISGLNTAPKSPDTLESADDNQILIKD